MGVIAVAAHGSTGATAGPGSAVRRWDLDSGALLETGPDLYQELLGVAFAEDGHTIVVQTEHGALSWPDGSYRDGLPVSGPAAGGLRLDVSVDGTATLCDERTGAELDRFDPVPSPRPPVAVGLADPYELLCAAGSADGRRWIVGGRGGQVHILAWNGSRLRAVRSDVPTEPDAVDGPALAAAIRDPGLRRAALRTAVRFRYNPAVDEPDVIAALEDIRALTVLHRVDQRAAIALLDRLREDDPGLPVRMLGEGDPERLLARFGSAGAFGRELIARALEPHPEAVAAALHAFPPGWWRLTPPDVDRLIHRVWRRAAGKRRALGLLVSSPVPRAHAVAMDLFAGAHRDARFGGQEPPYTARRLTHVLRDCARRDLAGDIPEEHRSLAVCTLWLTYEPEDRELVIRLLDEDRDNGEYNLLIWIAGGLVADAPGLDDGLVDALRRIAADPAADERQRADAALALQDFRAASTTAPAGPGSPPSP